MGCVGMLEHWLAILVVVAVTYFGVNYNKWLKRNRGCSAFTFWRATGGVADLFLWMATLNVDSIGHGIILFCVAFTIFLVLFYANYNDAKSVLHGFLMTLWLLLIGGAIMWLLGALMKRNEKR